MGMTKMSKSLFLGVIFVILSLLLAALTLDNSLVTVERLATGKKLVNKSCTNCHDLQDFLLISDLQHMKTCMITPTASEKQIMVEFLSSMATVEVKCLSCHDWKRINAVRKTPQQWQVTVNKMVIRSEGQFSTKEIEVISVFLAMEQGIR
jgi:cytochrome c2